MSDIYEQVGEARSFDTGSAAKDAVDMVARHREAIIDLNRRGIKTEETIVRMMADTAELLKTAKAEAKTEWVPGGTSRQLDARFLRDDGGIQFGSFEQDIRFPDDSTFTQRGHGLLTTRDAVTPEHAALIRAYNEYGVATVLAKGGNSAARQDLRGRAFAKFRNAARAMPGRVGDNLRAMFNDSAMMKRVIGNASTTGAELIAIPTIADVRRPYDLDRRLVGLFRQGSPMSSAFKQASRTGRAIGRRRGATSGTPAVIPASTWATTDVTLTLVEMAINVLIDDSYLDEMSAVLDIPSEVLDFIVSGAADTWEVAALHGDTASTHQDAIATWTLGGYYTAGDLDGTSAATKFWIGLRARAFDDSTTVAGGGSFTAAIHGTALGLLGNLASGAVIVTGLTTLYTMLDANALFTTVDKFGPRATLTAGSLGAIGDKQVIISEFMKSDLPTSGLYTGSSATGSMIYVNPSAFTFHQGAESSWDVRYPEQGAVYMGMKSKALLASNTVSGEKPVALVINM